MFSKYPKSNQTIGLLLKDDLSAKYLKIVKSGHTAESRPTHHIMMTGEGRQKSEQNKRQGWRHRDLTVRT